MKNKYSDFFCPVPFEFIYIDQRGNVNPHCAGLVTLGLGNLREQEFFEAWNSETAQLLRKSILDGSFTYCLKYNCGPLQEKKLPEKNKINNPFHIGIIKNRLTVLQNGPAAINFGYDTTCNLSCPSCRTKGMFPEDQHNISAAIHNRATGRHIKDARVLAMSGMGDPFASRLYRNFLQNFSSVDYPNLRLRIVTNGLLLTPDMWHSLSSCHNAIDQISISIDAATAATYRVNRGGDFEVLKRNLEFIGDLRRKNKIKELCIDFVVQANNYREIPLFVEMGEKYACDWVDFKHIENWGSFTDTAFREVAVHDPSHPEHSNFLKVLEAPVLKDPIVWMRNLSPLMTEDREKGKLLTLCDFEIYNLILNDMEWAFFHSKLSLNDIQSDQIRTLLNSLKDDIAEVCCRKLPGDHESPIEIITHQAENPLDLDDGFVLDKCIKYLIANNEALKEAESSCLSDILPLLDYNQQKTLQQLIKIKPLTGINTGYFPLKTKLKLFA